MMEDWRLDNQTKTVENKFLAEVAVVPALVFAHAVLLGDADGW